MRTGVQFVERALQFVGVPYVWGGASPRGFDCSGLVEYVLSHMGLKNVPRTSEAQYAWAVPIAPSQLQPGDLVFMNFPGEISPGHVMIWLGGGRVLQAPGSGQAVKVSKFDPQRPGTNEWGGTVVGYGRVPGLSYMGSPSAVVPGGKGSSAGGKASQVPASATAAGQGCLPATLIIFAVGTCIVVEAMLHFVP